MAENNSTAKQEKKNFWQSNNKFWGAIKEWVRKQIVTLKRRPNRIPLFVIVVSMVVYNVSVTTISYATVNTGIPNGGMMAFWQTLISILVCVSYMNTYPKREKVKIPMLIVSLAFLVTLFVLDILFYTGLTAQLATGVYDNSPYYSHFPAAQSLTVVHLVLLFIAILLCVTLPVYTKLLKKIDTSIEIAGSDLQVEIVVADAEV